MNFNTLMLLVCVYLSSLVSEPEKAGPPLLLRGKREIDIEKTVMD